jgi:hypothetical protein
MLMAFLRQKQVAFKGDGIIIFQDVAQAIRAEKLMKRDGYDVRLIAPPPEYRMGCDLSLEIDLARQASIEQLLKEKDATYVGIFPMMKGTAELCDIIKVTDFGQWTMVRAGNMKLAFDKSSGIIVNSSGGGCPDIPYLYAELVDKPLTEAPRPKDRGSTLCAVMLDRAFEVCLGLWQGSRK